MTIIKTIIAVLLVLVGAVFALQGANVLTDSPVMSGRPTWLYIGVAMVLVGLVGLYWTHFRKRRT
jgi:uncharacterized membrane protein HdeD (DUF308 family)